MQGCKSLLFSDLKPQEKEKVFLGESLVPTLAFTPSTSFLFTSDVKAENNSTNISTKTESDFALNDDKRASSSDKNASLSLIESVS